MSAGAAGQNASVRTTLIRILADTSKSVNELKDLGTQLASATKGYLYLKHVLGGMIRAYDELDAVIRRSTDVYAKQNIHLTRQSTDTEPCQQACQGPFRCFNSSLRPKT